MSAPPFRVKSSPKAAKAVKKLRQTDQRKFKKVQSALEILRDHGPSYPALRTHGMQAMGGPKGETIYNSYVENHTPGAWRILWLYPKGTSDEIYIVSIGPHG